jgi:hypothetical protein
MNWGISSAWFPLTTKFAKWRISWCLTWSKENLDSSKVGQVMDLSWSAILTSSGKGFSLHLFHPPAPMHFYGGFTGIELRRNSHVKAGGRSSGND